jgi:hypothetical protein
VATYVFSGQANGRFIFTLSNVAPLNVKGTTFPDSVKVVSPTFVEIFNQAETAEGAALKQLVGIGLRKAIEFLVKDYAASTNASDAEAIRKTQLGPCIDKYIDDVNVKACAKRAAWLGNDETHYIRKWEDKDIEDLKILVRLTVNWIENVFLTAKYVGEMKDPKLI